MQQKNPIQSYRKIFAIALPMILSAISIPMLGIVDTAILGHLDSPVYLAAINIGATIFNMLFWGFSFLKMSTTGLVAQSYGANDQSKINQQLTQALAIGLAIAIILLLFQHWIGVFAITIIAQGGLPADMALQYFQIRILSAPATLLIYVFFGYFLAIQQANKVLFIMLVNQLGNMILNYIFVMKFHWGIAGVAYGSVISEYAAVFLGLYFLFKSAYKLPNLIQLKQWLTPNVEMQKFFSLNRDIFIRTLCLMTVFAMMTRGSARLGELSLAANAVLLNFFYLMSYGLDGFAHAVESLCGQAYGANDKKALKQIMQRVFVISLVIAIIFSVLYILYGAEIVNLLTSLKQVQDYASHYIIWLVIIPVIAMPSFIYDGLFIATTEAKIMRNSMVMATIFCYIPLWYLLRVYDNHGLWLAFLGFFIVRTTTIHIYYRRWIKKWEPQISK
ncbi:DNA-damage-inducible protein F [hydrothermal vent metagenome]|uniref:DNA-damage-inducible protein F n=1 Tax=hydrothermal vent metagenome TaxID=652676 RepID=A0A3B0V6E2_9ZZZZ